LDRFRKKCPSSGRMTPRHGAVTQRRALRGSYIRNSRSDPVRRNTSKCRS
jgi:hypothetical protein